MTDINRNPPHRNTRRWLASLAGVAVVMFLFAIVVMPPFYDAICRLTGLNGKVSAITSEEALAQAKTLATANLVAQNKSEPSQAAPFNVQFLADTDPNMPWSFVPDMRSVRIQPGVQQMVTFTVHNPTTKDMVGQAIPSISPAQAVSHLKKMECFCFQRQELKAGETRQLTMVFYLDSTMPTTVADITMAYKFFDITDQPAG
jgi:cytochrome c oxidase assembly protein subunit 11